MKKKNRRTSRPYQKSVYRSLAVVTQFGIHMLVPICLMSALGIYLDRKLDTSFIMILFFFIGAVAGAQNVYRLAKNIYSASSREDKPKAEDTDKSKTE